MTEIQFGLAIGVPAILFALNFIAVLWQARGLERNISVRFEALEKVIDAGFKLVDAHLDVLEKVMNARFAAAEQALLRVEGVIDARLHALEERHG